MNRQRLAENRLHVWYIHLDDTASLEQYYSTLTVAERGQASKFYLRRDEQRYIVAHGVLRKLLGVYTDRRPVDVPISSLDNGKPVLTDASLEFNLAHSHALAVVAIARRRVGVDIERLRPIPDAASIADCFFAEEARFIRQVPEDSRSLEFLRRWTLREAYLKGLGVGLSVALQSVRVPATAARKTSKLNCHCDGNSQSCWQFGELQLEPSYIGAVAVEGSFDKMEEFSWGTD